MRVPAVLRSWRFLVAILLAVVGGAWLWHFYRPLSATERQIVGGWQMTASGRTRFFGG
jgi:hypothetical protein